MKENEEYFDSNKRNLLAKGAAGLAIGAAIPLLLAPNKAYAATSDTLISVNKAGAGATTQHEVNESRSYFLKADFGAIGSGAVDDGPSLVAGIAAAGLLELSKGTYLNSSVAATLPLNQTIVQQPGAKITTSGSGGFTQSGNIVSFGYNPDNVSWSPGAANLNNYEGLSSNIGGYGVRNHIGVGIVTAMAGSVNVPSTATVPAHGAGVAGYAKTSSSTTGAVGVYGVAESLGTACQPFAGNFLVKDNGNYTACWGVEIDANISNAASVVRGLSIVGGSIVEPVYSPAINISPLGVGTTPVKRWSHGILTDDGAAQIGVQIGASLPSASQGSQSFNMMYRNSSNVSTIGFSINVDPSGNTVLYTRTNGTILDLGSYSGGVPQSNIRLYANQVGFFGSLGRTKGTVTGSRGGNVALASLLTLLANHGLITDSST